MRASFDTEDRPSLPETYAEPGIRMRSAFLTISGDPGQESAVPARDERQGRDGARQDKVDSACARSATRSSGCSIPIETGITVERDGYVFTDLTVPERAARG